MALLKAEADKLSQNDLVTGIIEEIIDKEFLFERLPFAKTEGKSYDYNRENTLSEAEFLDPYDTVPEGAATFSNVVTKLKILAGDVDVDKFISGTESDQMSQIAVQLAAKAKGLTRKLRRTLAIGDSGVNAKEFDGVKTLVDAGQVIAAGLNGSALSFSMLDELCDAVPNGADVLMVRSGTLRAYRALLRAAGGITPEHIIIPGFGEPILAHNGVPFLVNDFLPGDETQGSSDVTCSAYAIRMNEADGLHMIWGGDNVGIVVENVGTVQNKDAVRWRLKWYLASVLKSTKSLARLKGVTSI